ncbi:MAG: hypothetical protein HFH50_09955 [Lachnospiraceae bacterium]|jgi:hypothetical protein|nr:hypothetical protein [Lachnospiraceae bacterium]GFI32040.1 hypothetical protein IMSAGC013_03439 [Lachnospiraceae bacterium]
MEIICKDRVFGEMTYKHRWYKQQSVTMFGKSWNIKVVAKAYSGKRITEEQRRAYRIFSEKEEEVLKRVGEKLKSYVNDSLEGGLVGGDEIKKVEQVCELEQMITPTSLLFKQDGTAILLFDCVWDVENGVAVKLFPEMIVGPQDIFL